MRRQRPLPRRSRPLDVLQQQSETWVRLCVAGTLRSFREVWATTRGPAWGGAARVAARMRASTSAGAGLVSFLQTARDGTDVRVSLWVQNLLAQNPSSEEVVDAIVRELAPPGGSADEESLRDSMSLALSELILLQPNVELLQMNDMDTWTLLQLFLGHEVCNRLEFDIGQFFESAKLDPQLGVKRELEMRDFVKNEVGVQLDVLRRRSPNPTKEQLDALVRDAVQMTFEVYEGTL